MPIPNPIRLFHITAIANLASIAKQGGVVSKNVGAANGISYQNIAHGGAQGARAAKRVPNPPGGAVHDYVPFYFAPRSPMLMAIDRGNVQGCSWRQADILHFETTVDHVVALNRPTVFYDRNATLAFSQAFTDLKQLPQAIAWDLLTEAPQLDGYCKFWNSRHDNARYADRMERRQAEFLVHQFVPLSAMTRIGVIDEHHAKQVEAILAAHNVQLPVQVMTTWYF